MAQEQKQATPWIHCKDWWMAQWSLLIVWCDRFITPRTKCRGRAGCASRVLKTMWDKPYGDAASVYDHPSPLQPLSATAHHRSTYITDLWSDLQQLSREALRLMKPGARLPPHPQVLDRSQWAQGVWGSKSIMGRGVSRLTWERTTNYFAIQYQAIGIWGKTHKAWTVTGGIQHSKWLSYTWKKELQ